MKRTKKVTAENGQEIEVSLLVDGDGVHLSYERLGQGEGSKTLSVLLNQSGVDIQNGFPDEIDLTEEISITAAIADIAEELDILASTPQE